MKLIGPRSAVAQNLWFHVSIPGWYTLYELTFAGTSELQEAGRNREMGLVLIAAWEQRILRLEVDLGKASEVEVHVVWNTLIWNVPGIHRFLMLGVFSFGPGIGPHEHGQLPD